MYVLVDFKISTAIDSGNVKAYKDFKPTLLDITTAFEPRRNHLFIAERMSVLIIGILLLGTF